MAKLTATGKNIKNINSFIRDVANVYGKGSQQYEDITNVIADFDIYENKSGVLQISNSKENRRQHQKIRALKNRARRTRAGQRWKKALRESRTQRAAYRQYQKLKKDFNELMSEIYQIIDALAREFGIDITGDKWKMFSNPETFAYYKELLDQKRNDREYLREQYAETIGIDTGDEFTNPDFFD